MDRFNDFWGKYPRKLGKSLALSVYKKEIKTDEDFKKLGIALIKYLLFIKTNSVEQKFIMYGSTFMKKYMDYYELEDSELKTEEQKAYEEFMTYDN